MNKCLVRLINVLIVCFAPSVVFAYEYVNPSNQASVEADRNDIYSLKKMYEELSGEPEASEISYESTVNNLYWWPIGSTETTTVDGKEFAIETPENTEIKSIYGYRSSLNDFHNAIDIANYTGEGTTNIIAAKDGIVVYPTSDAATNCPTGSYGSTCGGGYGNYVIIQHADGNYTLYAHMYAGSITVKAGESVSQGQVIGKMGTSGSSTGVHLHFEIREGVNSGSNAVDPLNYVSQENPRPISVSGGMDEMREFIETWEGTGCGDSYQTDTEYIACYSDFDSMTTIGHGVTWEANQERFQKYGINYVGHGTKVSKEIVDAIEVDIINDNMNNIRAQCANEGIDDLKDYQLVALVSRSYQGPAYISKNSGYPSFIDAYLKYNGQYSLNDMYSSNGSIWTDAMNRPITANGVVALGLQRRRASEWILFTTGEIDYIEDYNVSQYAW